jgi:hypothetical protein
VAECRVQVLNLAGDVVGLEGSQVQTHAAVDVVANSLGHDEPLGGQHGTHRNPAGLVEVGCNRDLLDDRRRIKALGGCLRESLHRLVQVKQFEQLGHRCRFHGDLVVREKDGVNAVRIVNLHPAGVDASEARI